MKTVLLSDKWSFRKSGSKEWLSASVPGNIHSDLLAHSKIPDPYYGTNELEVQWIENEDWEYECCFIVAKTDLLKYENWDIVFEGLDTYSDVYLNDSLILSSDNMFRSFEHEIKHYLHQGINRLRIYFHSPIKIGKPKLKELPYTLPASNDTGKHKVSVLTRKAPYHFGWDWGPRLVTSGVWRPVYLLCWNSCRIISAQIKQKNVTESEALIEAVLTVRSSLSLTPARIVIDGFAEHRTILHEGDNQVSFQFTINNPALWFPRPYDQQPLYNFKFCLFAIDDLADTRVVTTGLRRIELINKKDSIGTSFFFKVNGRPVFMKGADYIPQDNLLNRVSTERYETIIQNAVEANMNMLRVWGGGIYEDDRFYRLCDKFGILVWQDFMFACSMYPGTPEFIENVTAEAEEQITRLGNYACLAIWCGNNEIDIAWKYWGWQVQFMFSKKDAAEISCNYDILFKNAIPSAVERFDGTRPYVHTSPLSNWGKKDSYNNGSMHYWGVWHGDKPFSEFKDTVPRFMVEYGFQSFPSMPLCRQFAGLTDLDMNSAVMKAHQKSYKGNKTIVSYLKKEFSRPESFAEFVYYSHLLQAQGIEYAIRQHRLKKGHCMGTLFWQLNDSWPGPSWSAIDYSGRRKALFFAARRAYNPVTASVDCNGSKISVSLISDFNHQTAVQTNISIRNFDGSPLFYQSIFTNMEADSVIKIFETTLRKLVSKLRMRSTVMSLKLIINDEAADEQFYYFAPCKSLKLPKPEYSLKVSRSESGCDIEVTAATFLKNLYLETNLNGITFSDNYFDMLPGVRIIHVSGIHSPGDLQRSLTTRTLAG